MTGADTWLTPSYFSFMTTVILSQLQAVRPDYFSATGQLWGNPLYDWDYLEATDYEWWFERIKVRIKAL